MSDVPDLSSKDVDLGQLAQRAAEDPRVLQQLLDGVSPASKKATIRHNSSEALMRLAERRPEALLPHWDYLVDLLHSGNGFSQYVAVHTVASLTKVDHEGRFEKALDAFYDLLGDESMMVASHVAGISGMIAQTQPHLQSEITRRRLCRHALGFPGPFCRERRVGRGIGRQKAGENAARGGQRSRAPYLFRHVALVLRERPARRVQPAGSRVGLAANSRVPAQARELTHPPFEALAPRVAWLHLAAIPRYVKPPLILTR